MKERRIIERESLWVCINTETGKFVPNCLYQTNKYAYPTERIAREQFSTILEDNKYKIVEFRYNKHETF